MTQYRIYLRGFCSDKKEVQLLIWMLLQRFCTVSTKTYYVFHSDTVLCRIASCRFVKKLKYFKFCEMGSAKVCDVLRRSCYVANPLQAVALRCRIAKLKYKSAFIPIIDNVQLMQL